MKEIDVRGLSCPEPVLIVMDEMDAAPKEPASVLQYRENVPKSAVFPRVLSVPGQKICHITPDTPVKLRNAGNSS